MVGALGRYFISGLGLQVGILSQGWGSREIFYLRVGALGRYLISGAEL